VDTVPPESIDIPPDIWTILLTERGTDESNVIPPVTNEVIAPVTKDVTAPDIVTVELESNVIPPVTVTGTEDNRVMPPVITEVTVPETVTALEDNNVIPPETVTDVRVFNTLVISGLAATPVGEVESRFPSTNLICW